jgi:hypothetical protein
MALRWTEAAMLEAKKGFRRRDVSPGSCASSDGSNRRPTAVRLRLGGRQGGGLTTPLTTHLRESRVLIFVQASDRLSSAGRPRRVTVSISSRPSSRLPDTPGASCSKRCRDCGSVARPSRHRRAPRPGAARGVLVAIPFILASFTFVNLGELHTSVGSSQDGVKRLRGRMTKGIPISDNFGNATLLAAKGPQNLIAQLASAVRSSSG